MPTMPTVPTVPPRTLADGRRWMAEGTKLFLDALAGLDEAGFSAPSGLPGWNRKQLVAHVAANAEAIGNLIAWAATGVETPMYLSPEARAAGIAKGLTMSAEALDSWAHTSAERLAESVALLSADRWQREVVTAQGRTVPASETPWMRAREVCVHAVDLGTGITFADLSEDFNAALREEILAKRGMDSLPAQVAGAPLPEVVAWLAGRPHSLAGASELGAWL